MDNTSDKNRSTMFKWTILTGLLLGASAVVLLRLGNPPNMGICAACFIRDFAGGLMFFAKPDWLQYLRPEVPSFILGATIAAIVFKKFKSSGGSSPAIRFLIGLFVMVGALVFMGCPIRLVERIAAGDYVTAGIGLIGLVAGASVASLFIKRGFSLGTGTGQAGFAGLMGPLLALAGVVLILYIAISGDDPKGILATKRSAPLWAAFILPLAVGFFAQRSNFCSVGGFRDVVLDGDFRLIIGFATMLAAIFVGNIAIDQFWPGTLKQFHLNASPAAHTVHLWNFLGMFLVGLASILIGGCPFRQLIAAGRGNTDALMAVFGMMAGASLCHNFSLAAKPTTAASAGGPGTAGMAAVIIGVLFCLVTGFFCRFKPK